MFLLKCRTCTNGFSAGRGVPKKTKNKVRGFFDLQGAGFTLQKLNLCGMNFTMCLLMNRQVITEEIFILLEY